MRRSSLFRPDPHPEAGNEANPCPKCLSRSAVIETRHCSNGTIRRRHECKHCRSRWTTHEGEPPGHRGGRRRGSRNVRRPLSAAEVELILTSTGSISAVARQLGRSRPAVAAVLQGRSHADLFPALPRRQSLSCLQCQHWTGRCGLGFPDPLDEGPSAAEWCNSYLQINF